MDIKTLKYFHLLAQLKSFTKVAEKLNVSQPTITYAIKRLEQEFGKELFIRNQAHHAVSLTLAGKILDIHIKNILEEFALAQTEIARLKKGKVAIGLPPIIGNHYLEKISTILMEKNIYKDVNLVTSGSQELFKLIKNGRLSLSLIGSIEPVVDKHLKVQLLTEKKFMIVVSSKHPLANRKSIHFSELKNERFIILNERFAHLTALNKLAVHNNFMPNIIYRSSDLSILKGMIKQQLGIGFLTEIAINNEDDLINIPIKDYIQPKFLISLVQSNPSIPSTSQELVSNLIISTCIN